LLKGLWWLEKLLLIERLHKFRGAWLYQRKYGSVPMVFRLISNGFWRS